MDSKCAHCSNEFRRHRAVPNHRYCAARACQNARRNQWLKQKLSADQAYRENKTDAQKDWVGRNGSYWKTYREQHGAYAEQNRIKQRERNRRRRSLAKAARIAKKDELRGESTIISGRYHLTPVWGGGIAKKDALIVEIGVITGGFMAGGS